MTLKIYSSKSFLILMIFLFSNLAFAINPQHQKRFYYAIVGNFQNQIATMLQEYDAKLLDVDFNARNDSTMVSIIEAAVSCGSLELVQALLERGATVNQKLPFDRSFVMRAIEREDERILQLVLDHGAEVHLTDKDGYNPLYLASGKSNAYELCKVLISAKCALHANILGFIMDPIHYSRYLTQEQRAELNTLK